MEQEKTRVMYSVQTPVYEGPLDLLLQLIEQAELDITVLALAQVTDQYLVYIKKMKVPPEEISSFLVIATKLMQIKSEALLPRPVIRGPGEEDPGKALADQLRVYKRFKQIAQWLDDRVSRNFRTYLRVASLPKIEEHLDLSDVTIDDITATANAIFAQQHNQEALSTVIAPPRITIREKIAYIAAHLGKGQHSTFNDVLSEHPSRLEIVVTFLALLELVKRYRVSARQEGIFKTIFIDQLEEWGNTEDMELEFE